MDKMIKRILTISLLALPVLASAQEWDDIYYNPDKDKKAKEKVTKTRAKTVAPLDYAPAGSYTGQWTTANLRNDDEYNRRVNLPDSLTADSTSAEQDNFAYTRRIERFHNPDVVVETGNEDLVDWYYNQQEAPQSVVVVNVESRPWYWYPYGYRSWYRPYGFYSGYWGPTWGFGFGSDPWFYWGYDPWYSWGWGPSYGWGWTPGPSWGWVPNPGRPVAGGWRPAGPGASRPHGVRYTGGRGNYAAAGTNARPGNMGRPTSSGHHVSSSAWMRPGNSGTSNGNRNYGNAVNNARPGNSGNRTVDYNNSSSRHNNSSSNRPTYNSGSNFSGSHHSGGSMGGRGGSYGGGGSRGGGSRGGRR